MSQAKKMFVSLAAALVLAAALGGYAYFGVFQPEREEIAAQESEERLFPLEAEEVTAFTLQVKGETIELEKGEAGWRLVSPLEAPADEREVEKILGDLSRARRLRLIEDEADLRHFGLAKPRYRIEARTAGGETAYLAVGTPNSFDETFFASRAPGQVVAASSLIKTTLEKTTFDLREKKLVPFSADEVEGIEIEGDERLALARVEGVWRVRAPREGRADEEEAKALLRKLVDLRASAFPERAAEDLGEPSASLTLRPAEGEALALRFWEAEGKAYAQVAGGALAEVPERALEPLEQDPEALFDQRIAPFDTEEVAKVEVRAGEERFTLGRTETGWAVEEPEEAPARRWKVNAGIQNLADLRPAEVLPADQGGAHGLDQPARTLRLFDDQGGLVGAYHLGDEEDEHTYLRIEGKEAVYKVRSIHVVNVPRSLDDVKEKAEDA